MRASGRWRLFLARRWAALTARAGLDAEDWVQIGELSAEHENHAQAAAAFEQALIRAPTSIRVRCDLAYFYFRLGRVASAIGLWKAAAVEGADGEVAILAAACLCEAGFVDEATPFVELARQHPELELEVEELKESLRFSS